MTDDKDAAAGTQHQFGNEWDVYREIVPVYEEHFRRWVSPLPLTFFAGKDVLDAGCGIGRNSYWPLKHGATRVFAFDFDQRTVDVARENLKEFANAQVQLLSIYDLAKTNEFDVAMSIGVVHHLAHPKKAVQNLARSLKNGGRLILWVYAREGNERYLLFVNPLRRFVTSRLPPGACRALAGLLAAVLRVYIALPQKSEYLRFLRTVPFRQLTAIVFDQLLPTIANYWTKQEVLDLVAGLPLEVESLSHTQGMSWTLIARRRDEAPGG